jgi:hypothetical protein
MFQKICCNSSEGPGQIEIVAVQVRDNISRRSSQTLVNGVRLSSVFFANPVNKLILILSDYVNTSVRATAVHDNQFDRLVVLVQNGQNCLFEI